MQKRIRSLNKSASYTSSAMLLGPPSMLIRIRQQVSSKSYWETYW